MIHLIVVSDVIVFVRPMLDVHRAEKNIILGSRRTSSTHGEAAGQLTA
jgi:hypothetical protein